MVPVITAVLPFCSLQLANVLLITSVQLVYICYIAFIRQIIWFKETYFFFFLHTHFFFTYKYTRGQNRRSQVSNLQPYMDRGSYHLLYCLLIIFYSLHPLATTLIILLQWHSQWMGNIRQQGNSQFVKLQAEGSEWLWQGPNCDGWLGRSISKKAGLVGCSQYAVVSTYQNWSKKGQTMPNWVMSAQGNCWKMKCWLWSTGLRIHSASQFAAYGAA